MNKLRKIILFIIVSLLIPNEYVDVVNLKDGSIIKGQIIENKINQHIKIELSGGSIFKFEYNEIISIDIEKRDTSIPDKNIKLSNLNSYDCFSKGFDYGKDESTGLLLFPSIIGGYYLGIIGWGIGYAFVSGKTHPPYHKLKNDYQNCIEQDSFARGYKEGSRESKRRAVTFGSLLGWFIFLAEVDSDN